ncbi:MAG: type I phosphomannose isomerase catalytic subunit [Bacteriovoracaceae bacterium]
MSVYKSVPHIVRKIWGGQKLKEIRKLSSSGDSEELPVGETWEVSAHPDGPSYVEDSKANDGKLKLSDVITIKECPYLIKYIDTSDNLSVQVHPGDEYAGIHENSKGKAECWIILEAKSGAGIYLGVQPEVNKEDFFNAAEAGKDVSQMMRFFPVSRGDFFFVPEGTAHAIGKDVTLIEIQQCSGITYRVWDWNRVDDQGKGRELHIDHAKNVINFDPEANQSKSFQMKMRSFNLPSGATLVDHPDFKVCVYSSEESFEKVIDLSQNDRAVSIVCLKGSLNVIIDGQDRVLDQYNNLVLYKEKEVKIESEKRCQFLLIT